MIKNLAFLLAAALSSALVHANPSGSPICKVDAAAVSQAMGGTDDKTLGWSISVSSASYASGDKLTVSIKSSAGATAAYKGLLLYARTTADSHVGKWELVGSDYKTLDNLCASAGPAGSTLTQASSSKKTGTGLTWVAPDSSAGTVEFRGMVVSSTSKWMVLPPVTVTPSTGAAVTAPTGPVSAPVSAPVTDPVTAPVDAPVTDPVTTSVNAPVNAQVETKAETEDNKEKKSKKNRKNGRGRGRGRGRKNSDSD